MCIPKLEVRQILDSVDWRTEEADDIAQQLVELRRGVESVLMVAACQGPRCCGCGRRTPTPMKLCHKCLTFDVLCQSLLDGEKAEAELLHRHQLGQAHQQFAEWATEEEAEQEAIDRHIQERDPDQEAIDRHIQDLSEGAIA